MCGVVGYVGARDAAEHVLDGLRRLEYRGYDSAGIATIDDGEIRVCRREGKLRYLESALREEPLSGSTAIGHTRWATHGVPSERNAHPHRVGDIVLVHNGIIENFAQLVAELQDAGHRLESETDSEVIAHLIAHAEGDDLASRVRAGLKHLRGAYAIVVGSVNEPDVLVAAKNASPMVIGFHDRVGIVASDIPALLSTTREITVLVEGEMAVVRPGAVAFFDLDGAPLEKTPKTIDWSPVMAEKGGYKHFMLKEIHEQPRAIADTLRGRIAASGTDVCIGDVVRHMAEASRIVFAACGTSAHAAMVGRVVLEQWAGIPCDVEWASELRHRPPVAMKQALVVAVSQSGETADTLGVVKHSAALGATTAGIVNVLDSSIARHVDSVTYTQAGPEIGVASTKAFLTQVVVLMLAAVGAARKKNVLEASAAEDILHRIVQLPLQVESIIKDEARVIPVASRVAETRSALFLGRAMGFPVALEGALKLKEISYIHAEGYAAGELKHGPIALIERGVPVVAVATAGPLYEKMVSSIQEVRARQGYVIAIGSEGDTQLPKVCDVFLPVPSCDPVLGPVLAAIWMQLLAYHVADIRGTDVDQPRNLAKSVTVE